MARRRGMAQGVGGDVARTLSASLAINQHINGAPRRGDAASAPATLALSPRRRAPLLSAGNE